MRLMWKFMAVGLLSVSAGSPVSANYKVRQIGTAAAVHMRAAPSNTAKVLAYIHPETVVEAAGKCSANWCPVAFKNLKGWVFKPYMDDTSEPPTPFILPVEGQTPFQAPDAYFFYAAPISPMSVVRVLEAPGVSMAVVGFIQKGADGIRGLGRCAKAWCHIRYQQIDGWVSRFEIRADYRWDLGAAAVAAAFPPAPKQAAGYAANTAAALLSSREHSTVSGSGSPGPASEAGGPQRRFAAALTVVGINAAAWLPLRETPSDSARVLDALPPGADGIEDLRECVRQWCRVRYAGAMGFVQRRFLARNTEGDVLRYRVAAIGLDDALKVFDFPGADASIVGFIPSYASGIVPIGDCNKEWCHIRYLGLVGWVGTANLAADSTPKS